MMRHKMIAVFAAAIMIGLGSTATAGAAPGEDLPTFDLDENSDLPDIQLDETLIYEDVPEGLIPLDEDSGFGDIVVDESDYDDGELPPAPQEVVLSGSLPPVDNSDR